MCYTVKCIILNAICKSLQIRGILHFMEKCPQYLCQTACFLNTYNCKGKSLYEKTQYLCTKYSPKGVKYSPAPPKTFIANYLTEILNFSAYLPSSKQTSAVQIVPTSLL